MGEPNRLRPGDTVVLTELPLGLLDDLPIEEQQAISEMVGRSVRLIGYDDAGRAELEFADRYGQIHFLYVTADVVKAHD